MSFDKLQLKKCRDVSLDNVRRIGALFPDCVIESRDAEGRVVPVIDFEVLKSHLSKDIITPTQPERYQMNWPGKAQSRNQAYTPIDKTIRPVETESKDFATTENIFIEGDNLDVLKLLQESYLGKVKMIYIDPPYNTGKDFIYKDTYTQDKVEYSEQSDYMDAEGGRLVANPESKGRYHSDWLSMIYPRLLLARNLLRDDGVIFISIDDNEQANLKILCDEVFGKENFVACVVWRKSDNQANIGKVARVKEYILGYARSYNTENIYKMPLSKKALKMYNYKDSKGLFRQGNILDKTRGRYVYNITTPSGDVVNGPWMKSKKIFEIMLKNDEIYFPKKTSKIPYIKIYLKDSKGQIPSDLLDSYVGTNQKASKDIEKIFDFRVFEFSKPIGLINHFLKISTQKSDIILDFFAGSGTTAHAVMALNAEDGGKRTCISVQLPELTDEKSEAYKAGYKNIAEITKERIRRAGQNIPPPPLWPPSIQGFGCLRWILAIINLCKKPSIKPLRLKFSI